jgi:hypothetical protein
MAKPRAARDVHRITHAPGPRMRVKPTPPETITVAEAARRLGISKNSAYEGLKARRGARPAYRGALGRAARSVRAIHERRGAGRCRLISRQLATGAIVGGAEYRNC